MSIRCKTEERRLNADDPRYSMRKLTDKHSDNKNIFINNFTTKRGENRGSMPYISYSTKEKSKFRVLNEIVEEVKRDFITPRISVSQTNTNIFSEYISGYFRTLNYRGSIINIKQRVHTKRIHNSHPNQKHDLPDTRLTLKVRPRKRINHFKTVYQKSLNNFPPINQKVNLMNGNLNGFKVKDQF